MSGRKETVLDLAKFVDKGVQVKLTGGRLVTGTLKGYDQLLNLVLDEAVEFLRDPEDPLKTTDQTRRIGLIVCLINVFAEELLLCSFLQQMEQMRFPIHSFSLMGHRCCIPT
ncbi:sm-like protein LSM7 isoform X1 [Salvia splendens]|uniref:sm-like protein LSM7 isoform X1 n=1 Tax=Salvia splendens TaxID=180675 RepID=UPI001C27BE40|nr:sm-like protein LSM7 isoform X1 [Salvia splendens]